MTMRHERKDRMFRGDIGDSLPLDVKAISEEGEFEGYASVFMAEDQGGDIVMPGAFSSSLTRWPADKVKMLWQHDPSSVIGKYTEMREDTKGLYVKGRLFKNVQKGAEALELMREGAVEGLSIGYRTRDYEIDSDSGVRKLIKVDLREVSVVTFPMLDIAGITLVKSDGTLPTERMFERHLVRDAGFTAQQAKAIIATGYKSLTTARDAGDGDNDELATALAKAAARMRG